MKLVVFIWELFVNLLESLCDIVSMILAFALSSVHWLHVETPRLEGLLVGVLFTWLYVHRDRHPILRSLGAPMKLILDVLDAVWDNISDFMGGIKDAVLGWIQSCSGLIKDTSKRLWGKMLDSLSSASSWVRSRGKK